MSQTCAESITDPGYSGDGDAETLALGLTELLGDNERLSELLGESDAETDALGETLDEGETLALILLEGLNDWLTEALGEIEDEGDTEGDLLDALIIHPLPAVAVAWWSVDIWAYQVLAGVATE